MIESRAVCGVADGGGNRTFLTNQGHPRSPRGYRLCFYFLRCTAIKHALARWYALETLVEYREDSEWAFFCAICIHLTKPTRSTPDS